MIICFVRACACVCDNVSPLMYMSDRSSLRYSVFTVNGFLLTCDRQVLKLANFSEAVPQSLLDENGELGFVVLDTLPVDTVPPEVQTPSY